VLLAFALSVAVGEAHTQSTQGDLPQSPSGKIHGVVRVLDQQKEPSPLEGIRVELRGSAQDSQLLAVLTDSAGHFEFTQLPPGIYTFRVNQQGFKPFTEMISLNAKSELSSRYHPCSQRGSRKGGSQGAAPERFDGKFFACFNHQ
jgi:carboxypeptidase family protein